MDGDPSAPGQSREYPSIPPTQDPWAHAPGLPSAESSSQLSKGCNSLESMGGDSGPHTSGTEGPREESGAGSGQSPACRGTRREFLGGREAAPGKEEAVARGVGDRGEQRATLAVADARGTLADSSRAVVPVEKAGRGEGWEPAGGAQAGQTGRERTRGVAPTQAGGAALCLERFRHRSENKPVCAGSLGTCSGLPSVGAQVHAEQLRE